ncbi:MAG: ATP-binding cassette domain-containing protein [Clostridiales bacterium]|nr:ATP-binding cassette domain-containing protein [Clostridiales bacterium]
MMLEIKNLTKNYGNITALQDVTITLDNGIYGLLGPNGAGKSTLISLLTDNLKREKGEILYNSTEILKLGRKYRNDLGYMPQQQGYYEELSAGAFLIYMAQLKGMKKKEASDRVSELLDNVNLSEFRNKKMGSFSGGMKQRILLAQALLNDPKVLVLDEPTAGVDPKERIGIRNFISEIAKDRIVLLATHIVSDVESIAKEILLLKKGNIIRKGTPYSLIEEVQPYVKEIYIQPEELPQIQEKFAISNLRYSREGLAVKVITKENTEPFQVTDTTANLEDVYLYYFE